VCDSDCIHRELGSRIISSGAQAIRRVSSRCPPMGTFQRALAVLLALSTLAACGGIAKRVSMARELASGIQPDHRYRSFANESMAMSPTMRIGTLLLVDESVYGAAPPQRGDIIVFMPPIPSKAPFIKRVVAIPGDKLSIRNHTIEVNGRPLARAFPPLHPNYDLTVSGYRIAVDGELLDPALADVPPRSRWTAPDRLPRGCYYLIGDNVGNSEDSHVWGCAELSGTYSAGQRKGEPAELVGKVVKIVNPPAK
jgi:signal peptidase I